MARMMLRNTVLIPDGPFAGELLRLHEVDGHSHWRFHSPNDVITRHPWALTEYERHITGECVDENLKAMEALGPELHCARCEVHAGVSITCPDTGEHLGGYINASFFIRHRVGYVCVECISEYITHMRAALQMGEEEHQSDEPMEDDEDGDEAEAGGVPAHELAALTRHGPRRASGEPCPICFEIPSLVFVLPCAHELCQGCATTWLGQASTCPTCRGPVAPRRREV